MAINNSSGIMAVAVNLFAAVKHPRNETSSQSKPKLTGPYLSVSKRYDPHLPTSRSSVEGKSLCGGFCNLQYHCVIYFH